MKSKKKKKLEGVRGMLIFFLFKGEILCMKFYELLMYCIK